MIRILLGGLEVLIILFGVMSTLRGRGGGDGPPCLG
jgi:hypothetical protein